MDFLDPKHKKSHGHRLLVGYLLIGIAISMATWLLLNSSLGYWVDPKTGDVIQNGTVFLESQPSGSTITLNGKQQGNKTATRLVLPGSQQYNVKLTQDGYRDWFRTFSLGGGNIERLVYPLLIPKTLTTAELQLYASTPNLYSQSPDRRWLIVQQPGQLANFDLYDLSNSASTPTALVIQGSILTDVAKPSTFAVVEWAGDYRHVLLKRSYADTHEFIMLDISEPINSVNINTSLTITPSGVSLRNKKADQVYVFDAVAGTIRQGDLKTKATSNAIVSSALSYKTYGSDIIMYTTRSGAAEGKLNYRIIEADKASYLLKSVPDTNNYIFDVSEFDGRAYYVLVSPVDGAAFVYRDPMPALKGQTKSALLVSAVMRLENPQALEFSTNGKFISVQSGNKMVVYDIEGDRQFVISLKNEIDSDSKVTWVDGFRFVYASKGQSFMVDFDGSNTQQLVPAYSGGPVFFTPDSKAVYSLAPSIKVTGRTALTQTSLIKK